MDDHGWLCRSNGKEIVAPARKQISPSIYVRVVKRRIGSAKWLGLRDLGNFGREKGKIEMSVNIKISFRFGDLLRNLEKLFL